MGWLQRMFGGGSSSGPMAVTGTAAGGIDYSVLAAIASDTLPDLTEFHRASWANPDAEQLLSLACFGPGGVTPRTPPDAVPFEVIDAMGHDPVVAFGEFVATGPAQDPELYYVRHSDPAVRAVVEAWLRPLLAELLPAIVRAFAYGVIPIVMDWGMKDLAVEIKTGDGASDRRVVPGHAHYVRSHEVFPGDAQVGKDASDRILSVTVGGRSYGGQDAELRGTVRAFLARWNPRFGRLQGDGSRRRAFTDWSTRKLVALWESRYLEKSVDVPRVGYAPDGTIKINGVPRLATELLRSILQSLRGGSTVVVPATRDANGQRVWEVSALNLPDRSEVWNKALNRYDARVLLACMAPGASDAGAKGDEGLLSDVCQAVATFAASVLTTIVGVVHELEHGPTSEKPVVLANDIPKAKKRILKEIFARCADAVHTLKDGRTYTLAQLIHPELLDQLNIRSRTVEEAAQHPKPAPAPPAPPAGGAPPGPPTNGPPKDSTSDREGRRDAARTDQAAQDTGAPKVDGEDRGGER